MTERRIGDISLAFGKQAEHFSRFDAEPMWLNLLRFEQVGWFVSGLLVHAALDELVGSS